LTRTGAATLHSPSLPCADTPCSLCRSRERSIIRPAINGPRSVIFTTADSLFVRSHHRRTIVPIGSVRCAAVIAFWSK
jgi:hypothetical protein